MFTANSAIAERVERISLALMELSPGETITYAKLSKAAGEKINGGSYILQRALAKTEKDTGSVFDNVHGTGYQRLTTSDMPGIGKKANNRIRRVARKTRKRFENVRANDLTTSEVATLAAYRSHFGMLEGIAREQSVKALKANVETAQFVDAQSLQERMAALMGAGQK